IYNLFDHFVFRNDLGSTTLWSAGGAWNESGTANIATMDPEDAYANAILEFRTNDSSDYTATNDMLRATSQTYMLNELRFTGDFAGEADHEGLINGNSLLFTKKLSGENPRLQFDATATAPASHFTFYIDNELQLMSDLELAGDGTQEFVVRGNIRDYYESR